MVDKNGQGLSLLLQVVTEEFEHVGKNAVLICMVKILKSQKYMEASSLWGYGGIR